MNEEEKKSWDADIQEAQNTHPNAFANGPMVRSLLRTTLEVRATGRQVMYLTKALEDNAKEFHELNKNVKSAAQSSSSLSKALNRITLAGVIIASFGFILELVKIFR